MVISHMLLVFLSPGIYRHRLANPQRFTSDREAQSAYKPAAQAGHRHPKIAGIALLAGENTMRS